MEASLVIAADERALIHKTLMTMELKDLDLYMVQHYEDSSEVRKDPKFQSKIEEFLKETLSYRSARTRSNNGAIRVIYTDDSGQIVPIRAYYKKDAEKMNSVRTIAKIKRGCYGDLGLLEQLIQNPPFRMSSYCLREIRNGLTYHRPSWCVNAINHWVSSLAKPQNEDPSLSEEKAKAKGYFQIRMLSRYVEKYYEEQEKRMTAATRQGQKEEAEENQRTSKLEELYFPKEKKESLLEIDEEENYMRTLQDNPEELFSGAYPLEKIIRNVGISAFKK